MLLVVVVFVVRLVFDIEVEPRFRPRELDLLELIV
jgi:hypothetical protein